jgi:LacI family transcriptional regulator
MTARITLRDIAERTGYTVNTVSRALKDKEDIAASTRSLIKRVAEELGYIPDAVAASLRSGSMKTISVIIPDISDPLFAIWVKDIEMRLKERDFDMFIQNTEENQELEKRAVRLAIGKKIDGIILCPCQKDESSIETLKANGIPFVLIGRRFSRPDIDYVLADDLEGGYLATRHLLEAGHRRILFLNGPCCISSAQERLAGYRKALQEKGLPFCAELVREVRINVGECTRELQAIIERKLDFTGIFCFSDLMAWEAISYLQSVKLRVPDDVAVVGFDDIQSRLFYPYPLSSVEYSKSEIAGRCVSILFEKIADPNAEKYFQEVMKVRFTQRSSG